MKIMQCPEVAISTGNTVSNIYFQDQLLSDTGTSVVHTYPSPPHKNRCMLLSILQFHLTMEHCMRNNILDFKSFKCPWSHQLATGFILRF